MANFLFIFDPDPARRQFTALRAHSRVAFLPRLQGELLLAANYAAAWAAAPGAPVDRHCPAHPDTSDGLLFGEPYDDAGRVLSAEDLCRSHDKRWDAPSDRNGYYAAILVHPKLGVRIEADALGIFPIYYWHDGDVLLVGTSPDLFRCHPLFQTDVDLHGVAALLLTSGIVGGRTLWRNVRRLSTDHLLLCSRGGLPREISPLSLSSGDAAPSVDEVTEEVTACHRTSLVSGLRNAQRPGLLLSGGLDSRILAGMMADLGHRPNCLTFGRSDDLDALCATLVARELDFPQALCDVEPSDYADFANSSVVWEQLSGGLYALPMGWIASVRAPEVEMDRMVSGLTLDAVVGGAKHVASTGGPLSFERLRIAKLGYDADRLQQMIAAPDLARACDDIRDQLVTDYLNSDPADHLREWRMNLAHRQRFAVGACAWRYSLFCWPVMPALDRKLIKLSARLPEAMTRKRNLQTRMLVRKFPRLAQLELDRNYLDTAPLLVPHRTLAFKVRRRVLKWMRQSQAWLGRDPRFYVRTMEFNSPGWRVVRTMADEARSTARALFRPDALERFVPRASVVVHQADPIAQSTPLKNTLGLMLWLRQHA